jgi:hypothetical protein
MTQGLSCKSHGCSIDNILQAFPGSRNNRNCTQFLRIQCQLKVMHDHTFLRSVLISFSHLRLGHTKIYSLYVRTIIML